MTNRHSDHCLHLAVLSGNLNVVKLLLEKGVNPNIRSLHSSRLRMHPLGWGASYGRHEIVELLLRSGANVNYDFDVVNWEGIREERMEIKVTNRITALDMVEKILEEMEKDKDQMWDVVARILTKIENEEEGKGRFVKTRDTLLENGAKRFVDLEEQEKTGDEL